MSCNFDIHTLFPQVINAISSIGNRFSDNKGLIITESDLKCQIYSELRNLITEDCQTYDTHVLGSPLHSEVAFYNPNQSNFADMIVDFVLFNPSEFSILRDPKFRIENGRSTKEIQGKQYRTLGNTILIELKFNKYKNGITKSFNKSILKDITKMERIISFNSDKIFKGILVVFNKTNKYCNEFKNEILGIEREHIKVIYKSSDISFK